ncbi:MAG TPA: recombination protein RecR [Clostridiales bacterium]|jgi:recombination protein RecR|nr:recombination protein RecR [Clostridiales bacterium]
MQTPQFAAPVEQLIEYFQRLPGVGRKTAQRFAFHVMSMEEADVTAFAEALVGAKKGVNRCQQCQNFTDSPLCRICNDHGRDHTTICVVSEPADVAAIERAREYKGVYHVLHGVLSPLAHIGPEDLTIRELVMRVGKGDVKEVIMATDPDTTGETTAMYIAGLLKPFGIRVTRLAYGVPVGGHLEFADEVTLLRAIEGRREL